MAEDKLLEGPRKLWTSALRAVKGENAVQLVEQFTEEMTLVAEGLCEDQSKLRAETDNLGRELDRRTQRLESAQQAQEEALREAQRELEKRLDGLDDRLNGLEKLLSEKKKQEKHSRQRLMNQVIALVSIVCGSWVLVALLNFFKP